MVSSSRVDMSKKSSSIILDTFLDVSTLAGETTALSENIRNQLQRIETITALLQNPKNSHKMSCLYYAKRVYCLPLFS
jgi:hypothetical protein